jgi:hypothetical protein
MLYKAGMQFKSIQLQTRHSAIETFTKHYIDGREPPQSYIDKPLAVA